MTKRKTKGRKKILFLALPAAVVLLAAAGLLWLWLGQGEELEPSFTILRDQNSNKVVSCQLNTGLDPKQEEQRPLPFYSFDLPEGWEQIQDAAQTANRLSVTYQDIYFDESKEPVIFFQRYAVRQYDLMSGQWGTPDRIQEVQFGQRQMMFAQWDGENEASSALFWVQGESLLCLQYGAQKDVNQMLELAERVEQTPTRQPDYFPPELRRSSVSYPVGQELPLITGYCTIGNLELPENLDSLAYPAFSSAPAGYGLVKTEHGSDESGPTPWVWEYESHQGEVLQLTVAYGSMDLFTNQNSYDPNAFHGIPQSQLADASLVQDAQVGGNPALIYLGEEESSIGWVEGNYSLQIRSAAPMTAEELIALAETVE